MSYISYSCVVVISWDSTLALGREGLQCLKHFIVEALKIFTIRLAVCGSVLCVEQVVGQIQSGHNGNALQANHIATLANGAHALVEFKGGAF